MNLPRNHILFLILWFCCLMVNLSSCGNESPNESLISGNAQYNSFISARMKHLTAISNLKQMSNAVKQHQLIIDLAKKIFKALDESRKLPTIREGAMRFENLPPNDSSVQDVALYLENTSFLCDLLVFFPEITIKLLENNLLWRIMLIDSIEDAKSFRVHFVDENTFVQIEKAYRILTEGVVAPEPKVERKTKETKKPKKRGPRLTKNEL